MKSLRLCFDTEISQATMQKYLVSLYRLVKGAFFFLTMHICAENSINTFIKEIIPFYPIDFG